MVRRSGPLVLFGSTWSSSRYLHGFHAIVSMFLPDYDDEHKITRPCNNFRNAFFPINRCEENNILFPNGPVQTTNPTGRPDTSRWNGIIGEARSSRHRSLLPTHSGNRL